MKIDVNKSPKEIFKPFEKKGELDKSKYKNGRTINPTFPDKPKTPVKKGN